MTDDDDPTVHCDSFAEAFAVLTAQLDLEPGDEIELHDPDCDVEDCDCETVTYTVPERAEA